MRITSKGQVTIPKHIREKLGVKPGDDIGFREDGPSIILESSYAQPTLTHEGKTRGDYLIRILADFGRKHLIKDELSHQTTDEIMEDLGGYSQDANDPGFQLRS